MTSAGGRGQAVRVPLQGVPGNVDIISLAPVPGLGRLPYVLRVVVENLLRQELEHGADTARAVSDVLARNVGAALSFRPARIFGQDILGKVMLVDMAALRDALAKEGLPPSLVNPAVPVDIIIDHSLQVDAFARPDAAAINLAHEYRRNGERFRFLRWCAGAFERVRVVPPGKGIMHQIHLEHIGEVVRLETAGARSLASPDTCIGTDSHTPMINGLGILGWGVGGIEAEAVMLGRALAMALPRVIGVELTGTLASGVMPTDLVLTVTEKLRAFGVVGDFVEFFGAGASALGVAERGTIANMAPEYGATSAYFPVDQRTRDYLLMTGRSPVRVALVESYAKAQSLWRDASSPLPDYDAVLTIDLARVRPSVSGPRNPEERLDLADVPAVFPSHVRELANRAPNQRPVQGGQSASSLVDGDVVIAAITSCTNTSSPIAMIGAGLVARKAVARGLRAKPWVKTSLAPGSQAVGHVLAASGLQADLDTLGFHVVGYGCTTCNGGSGPLPEAIATAITDGDVVAAAVLSGNRNFQGRIHPAVRAAYLASPALVVAYALAGRVTADLTAGPFGVDGDGRPVHLSDIWPTSTEIEAIVRQSYTPGVFARSYAGLLDGGPEWDSLAGQPSELFGWQDDSTYIRRPPYFDGLSRAVPEAQDILGARPLAILGDNVTTDDISPSGAISLGTPSADFLLSKGVLRQEFNTYTTRRSNHEVALRATFANVRLRNRMVPGQEGGITKLQPDGQVMRIFEAAEAYRTRATPLVVIAGRNYGCGSSRDWAAKGVALLGVKAVIAESFERIHRANLVGMGVLPLQLPAGLPVSDLSLDGSETIDVTGLAEPFGVLGQALMCIRYADERTRTLSLTIRLETPEDILYWRNGGILPFMWRNYLAERA